MQDIIHLLPDSIANQIAAGEVVQRPASVVKELLENSIDAQAKNIQVIIKDAGRTLIQVIDDGIGMSATDARMGFERHATSKIRKTEDLFAIRTMGFRGEALASICAIAQVELRTRRAVDELGTLIRIDGSDFKTQESVSCPVGTNFQVKNLFFNVPARRNFLKSNPVEMRHILDEFQRVALGNPEVGFTLYHNDVEVYNLASAKLNRRITDIFGKNYREQLAACQEDTPFVSISGYVGKPESAKKGRGEQFFFVNNRYIKHGYLHHAILSAFEATIPDGSSPFYVIFIEIDPAHIDINIHPTKTEIKFDDERSVYAIIRSAIRRAIGVYNLTPSIDFESDINFGNISSDSFAPTHRNEGVNTQSAINNFERSHSSSANPREKSNQENWQQLFEGLQTLKNTEQQKLEFEPEPVTLGSKANTMMVQQIEAILENDEIHAIQIHHRFIAVESKKGMMLVDQRGAYERILYEKYYSNIRDQHSFSQQLLFPKIITLNPADFMLTLEIQPELKALGFTLEEFGQNTIKINGVPPEVQEESEQEIFEGLIEQYKNNQVTLKLDKLENVARSFARRSSSKYLGKLSKIEINLLIHQLFETSVPAYTPSGEPIFNILSLEQLSELILKK